MKVIVFGATGMIGQGTLRECLADPQVESVLTVGRAATGQQHPKLKELVHKDLYDYTQVEGALTGYDACLFCLGVSSNGMTEAAYLKITYELTMAAATTLARLNPTMTFVFISGASADSTEKTGAMWARVKGKTENALLKLPFRAVYVLRPGYIQPMDGITSRTRLYRVLYVFMTPLYPLWKRLFPRMVTTTRTLGRAMVAAARSGAPRQVLDSSDFNALVSDQ